MALKDEPSPKYASRGWNVPSDILQKYHFVHLLKSCWLLLLLNLLLPLLLLLLLLNLLWRTPAKHLPAAKHHGPKGQTDSKIRFPGLERPF